MYHIAAVGLLMSEPQLAPPADGPLHLRCGQLAKGRQILPLGFEVADDLFKKERVAFGLPNDLGHQAWRHLGPDEAGQESGDGIRRERRQQKVVGEALPTELGQRVGEGMRAIDLDRAVRDHHADSARREPTSEVLKQQQTRFIRPVEIFEDEEQSPLPGGGGDVEEEIDGALKEAKALTLGARRRAGRNVAEPRADFPNEQRNLRRPVAKLTSELVDRRAPDVVANCLDKGKVGRHPFGIVSAADKNLPAFIPSVRRELGDEPRLADPRLAADQDDSTVASLGPLQAVEQNVQFEGVSRRLERPVEAPTGEQVNGAAPSLAPSAPAPKSPAVEVSDVVS